jgi:hypothetical protein
MQDDLLTQLRKERDAIKESLAFWQGQPDGLPGRNGRVWSDFKPTHLRDLAVQLSNIQQAIGVIEHNA